MPPIPMADNLPEFKFPDRVYESKYTIYEHSEPAPLDPDTKSKTLSCFQPRISKYVSVSHDAAIEAQADLFGENSIGKVIGGMNAHDGDFTALCAAEALPERIAICSYFIEYAFVHDDVIIDAIPTIQEDIENSDMFKRALGAKNFEALKSLDLTGLKRKHARAKIWSILTQIDSEYAARSQKYWRQWFETAHGMRDANFANLEEYLATRALDCGANWVVGLMGWASGVELTPEEQEDAGPVTYLAYVVLAIVNDIWSWEKEKVVTRQSRGSNPLINCVHMVMQMQGTDEETAKKVTHGIIRKHEEQYCRLRDEYLQKPGLSSSLKKWFQVLEISMAGNALWSVNIIRYHKGVKNPYEGHFNVRSVFGGRDVLQSDRQLRGKENGDTNNNAGPSNAVFQTLTGLDDSIIWKPYEYITSMGSKGFRQHLIEALQMWYMVPHRSLLIISSVATMLHEASLMLDDIQDGSSLRRGKPAVHEIFGVGQTINTACFQINNVLRLLQQISPDAVAIYSEQMAQLYIGQGHDIVWTSHKTIPREEDYFRMVDGKTGGLFVLLYRLMRSEATQNHDLDLGHFMIQMGRCFQIRDDYQNLISRDYMSQRGFCQDLDEGKLSFPFIHAYQSLGSNDTVLTDLLHMRDRKGGLSREAKECILSHIDESGSLDLTQSLLDKLREGLEDMLAGFESCTGQKNWILRSMMLQLEIKRDVDLKKCKGESTWAKVRRVWGGYRDVAWGRELN
ncbi:polyprenyl synthetase [Aspergillus avenaceus]|uniref:Polyprenyl synthetase n=1 Tax=Aspergillus avenaceus TaxID=36643 RepID=A0A5N6TRZ1_ASPAV|nr:polyprenyl synthetase [Aspergillus avenaceus]